LALTPIIEDVRKKFSALIKKYELGGESVVVKIVPLSAEQAIGKPKRDDFPILKGKEVVIEAQFSESFGHAFTSQPGEFRGTINDIKDLDLDTDQSRAAYICTLNAVMAHLGMVTGTRHCRDDEPERCGKCIAEALIGRFGMRKVGLVGLQPAILENLVKTFGADNVRCTDLNPDNIGSNKFGIIIQDGMIENPALVEWCDVVMITSSALVNNTFGDIREEALSAGKHLITFGVTGAGICKLLDIERICYFGH
jgi:hypothetical protein